MGKRTLYSGAIASGGYDAKEMRRMTKLTQISDRERKRIVEDFLDEVLADLDVDPELEARLRAALPELPDEPSPEQVEAWIELAELVREPDFRARIRQMAQSGAAERQQGEAPDSDALQRAAVLVAERGAGALEAGIEPGSAEAELIVAEVVEAFGGDEGAVQDPALRTRLAERFEQGADSRAERYWQLLAVINGWPTVPSTMVAWRWMIDALRASA